MIAIVQQISHFQTVYANLCKRRISVVCLMGILLRLLQEAVYIELSWYNTNGVILLFQYETSLAGTITNNPYSLYNFYFILKIPDSGISCFSNMRSGRV